VFTFAVSIGNRGNFAATRVELLWGYVMNLMMMTTILLLQDKTKNTGMSVYQN